MKRKEIEFSIQGVANCCFTSQKIVYMNLWKLSYEFPKPNGTCTSSNNLPKHVNGVLAHHQAG